MSDQARQDLLRLTYDSSDDHTKETPPAESPSFPSLKPDKPQLIIVAVFTCTCGFSGQLHLDKPQFQCGNCGTDYLLRLEAGIGIKNSRKIVEARPVPRVLE